MATKPLSCRVMGHRWSFRRDDATLRWSCARGCDVGGERTYATAEEAQHYLRHFGRAPKPPTGLISALGGSVERSHHRSRSSSK